MRPLPLLDDLFDGADSSWLKYGYLGGRSEEIMTRNSPVRGNVINRIIEQHPARL